MTTLDQSTVSPAIELAIRNACRSITPSWPLDRWIAVNPFWNLREQDCSDVAATLASTTGVRLTMPRTYYRQLWLAGRLQRRHLEAAITAEENFDDEPTTADELERCLARQEPDIASLSLLSDLSDRQRPADEPMPWSTMVVDQISQHLADHFDRGQVQWSGEHHAPFTTWRWRVAADLSLPMRRGRERFVERVRALPTEPLEVVAQLAHRLHVDGENLEDYLTALLASVRGWASWAAFENWQAGLDGKPNTHADDPLLQVLAIRCGWELLLLDEHDLHGALTEWRMQLGALPAERTARRGEQRRDWLLQHALELSYQEGLVHGIRGRTRTDAFPHAAQDVAVRAVFCIDVRSERFRRHLESAAGTAISTHGFAGFFGLPVAHRELDANHEPTPRLPGLLAPTIQTTDRVADGNPLGARRLDRLDESARWTNFRGAPTSAFTFVESLGAGFLPMLIRKSLAGDTPSRQDGKGLTEQERAGVQPAWPTTGTGSSRQERADTAAGVLRAMGLERDLTPLVLFAGHGSSSANNAHAAGLECGACGGHSGETNARLLATLLNDPTVRDDLRERGIEVPDSTWFLGGLHDTTTDEVALFDVADVPDSHTNELVRLQQWLDRAGEQTRAERAPTLGLDELQRQPAHLLRALRRRARDWAQTRPEWGLANNAAIVLGPRGLTRGLDLAGRTFLHDYDHGRDADRTLLTQLLTAPVVVANWINLQYYASTVAPTAFGSGNKLLHNVVGGNLGVFEGNRGDLRIGLPSQSVHDGERLQHTPQRLTVIVAAPRAAIDSVLEQNEAPRSLADNRWLHLLRVADDGTVEQRLPGGRWQPFDDLLPACTPPATDPTPAPPNDAAPEGRAPTPVIDREIGDAGVWGTVGAFLAVLLGIALKSLYV